MSLSLNQTELYGELNPLMSSPGFEDVSGNRAVVLGGWEQNPDLMAQSLSAIAEEGVEVAGWSAFDSIDPVLDDESIDLAMYELGQLQGDYPMRMVLRALKLIKAFRDMPDIFGVEVPNVVVTHCAGANVFALATYLAYKNPQLGVDMPTHWLAVEPMLPSYDGAKKFAMAQFMPFEKRAKGDPTLISLKSLAHPDMPDLGMDRRLPLGDIVQSRGLWLLKQCVDGGNEVRALVSEQDYAAPGEPLEEHLGAENVVYYNGQERFGHGYMMAEPKTAGQQIACILRTSFWFEEI